MAITRQDAKHKIRTSAKKASTAIALGTVLTIDTNGFLTPAVAASTNLVGVAMQPVFAADADYASTTNIEYDEAGVNDQFLIDVTGGTPAQTNVGEFFDLSDAATLNLAANTVHHFKMVGIVGTTQAIVQFNPLVSYQS